MTRRLGLHQLCEAVQVYASDDKHTVELAQVIGKCSVLPAGSDLPGAVPPNRHALERSPEPDPKRSYAVTLGW